MCKFFTYMQNKLQTSEGETSQDASPSEVLCNYSPIIIQEQTTNTLSENSSDTSQEVASATSSEIIRKDQETSDSDVFNFIRTSTCINSEDSIVLGASLRGRSHQDSATDCQDFHLYANIAKGWNVFVVSDGAGSAKFAGRGSKANCSIFVKLLSDTFTKNQWDKAVSLPSELDWHMEFRSICERMKLLFAEKAKEECVEETDFNATLIVCILTPYGMLCGHIGDGRMGYQSSNGEWKSLMIPHKGEEVNQTLFLQNNWVAPRVPTLKVSGVYVPETRVVNELPKTLVLMSDGCERSAWECSIYDSNLARYTDVNKPHSGFMEPLVDSIVNEKDEERLQLFIDIMDKGTKTCEQERDDKTMLMAILK